MPSVSDKQHRFMEAIAHGWHKPGGGGPSVAVAKEFVAADKAKGALHTARRIAKKYADGGDIQKTRAYPEAPEGYSFTQAPEIPAGSYNLPESTFGEGPAPREYPMEQSLQQTQEGQLDQPAGIRYNDAGIPFDVKTGEELPVTERPAILPIAKDAAGNYIPAMPKALDIISNMMPGIVAPAVPIQAGEMALGAGAKMAKAAEAARTTGSTADEIEKLLSNFHAAQSAQPLDINGFQKVSGKLGTMPGGWMKDPATGSEWYVKEAPSAEQANNEKLTAELYKLAGVPVAEVRLTTLNGKPAIASRRIFGSQLTYTPDPYNKIQGLHENYAVDAWLNNRDAVGVGHENPLGNIIVDNNGIAHRIDTGGGLGFKGTGGPKEFGHFADELQTMKDADYNNVSAHVFGDVSPAAINAGAAKVAAIDPMEISKLVDMYGPNSAKGKADLLSKLLSRQADIASQAGLKPKEPVGSMARPEQAESPYEPPQYTQEDIDAYWDEVEAQHQHEYQLAKGIPDQTEDIIARFKDLDWKNYRPKMVESLPHIPGLSKSPQELEQLGFNPRVALEHGSRFQSGYPEEFASPLEHKGTERAFFAADFKGEGQKGVAHSYAEEPENITRYIGAPKKAAEINWPDLQGGYESYEPETMHQLIEAAHKKGLDMLVIHNISDAGGGTQTQYAILNPEILRAPHAKFDPKKLHLRMPLAGLVGGGLLSYGTLKGEKKEDNKMNRGGRPKKKAGGGPSMDNWIAHQASRNLHYEGMIRSPVPGRTDKLPLNVPAGSYVLPADIPSALGQGNTMAGGQILQKMFSSGPYGMRAPRGGGRPNVGSLSIARRGHADGGEADMPPDQEDSHIPIIAAGGEWIIHPDVVRALGAGDLTKGHRILDKFVLHTRKENIKTLKKLPGPKK